jgi:uncharacterized membrane protein
MNDLPLFLQKPNNILVGLILLLSLGWMFLSIQKVTNTNRLGSDVRKGVVEEILSEKNIEKEDIAYIGATTEQNLRVEIRENGVPRQMTVMNRFAPVDVGNTIYFQTSFVGEGEEIFEVIEISRTRGLFWLSLFFVFLVVIVSGQKGLHALVGLVFSLAVIFQFIVPQILAGRNAVWTAILGSLLMLVVTLYTSHGINKKSIAAFLGIVGTLLFVGLLAQFTVGALHFTGYGTEEASFLQQEIGENLNLLGLVIAGIIIASIGILDDIAVTQASTVLVLVAATPSIPRWDLFRKAMGVGKDHISAVINTLVLAYTGAALPLTLLFSFYAAPLKYITSLEFVTEEIVRTMISTAGLVIAVPLTTLVAVFLVNRRQVG